MTATAFQPVTWSDGQDIDADTLNQMATNDNWLYNNMPQAFYKAYGISKNTQVKITGGIIPLGPTKDKTIYKEIGFGNFFSASCAPVVVGTHTGSKLVQLSVGGIGSGNQKPDNRGFSVNLVATPSTATKNYFPHQIFVHWMALGW